MRHAHAIGGHWRDPARSLRSHGGVCVSIEAGRHIADDFVLRPEDDCMRPPHARASRASKNDALTLRDGCRLRCYPAASASCSLLASVQNTQGTHLVMRSALAREFYARTLTKSKNCRSLQPKRSRPHIHHYAVLLEPLPVLFALQLVKLCEPSITGDHQPNATHKNLISVAVGC